MSFGEALGRDDHQRNLLDVGHNWQCIDQLGGGLFSILVKGNAASMGHEDRHNIEENGKLRSCETSHGSNVLILGEFFVMEV